ncbi:MAG: bifunctional UDP-N-acetylglucosamine diphosphorylase/glucosamine-1-phosphate N-acetyltransferase GlmU [Frankiales bacterium]|nr:bifunctional UDP-N-acetylglucosamine diphosphorylase/glucosamine-1-phosphate N-acetyltransferase GlmU [Frankiales bacterium]
MSSPRPSAVVVLAAGAGTRMKSATPKVLHQAMGRTLLGHVLAAVSVLDPEHVVVVIGHGREQVQAYLADALPDGVVVVQETQNGTGHAMRVALEGLATRGVRLDGPGPLLVVAGDTPLLTTETLRRVVDTHQAAQASSTVLTAELADPTGYGRVLRDPATGLVTAIVEHKDADADQLAVREINSGVYAFDVEALQDALGRITTDNAQGEEYLTDVLGLHVADGRAVAAVVAADPDEILGVNDRAQLAAARALLRDRINTHWMREGVTIVDPATTWIDADVSVEPDAVIERNTALHGRTSVCAGAVVGPDTSLTDVVVLEGASVVRTQGSGAEIGPGATVGPFSYLRPGTRLAAGAKVGAFVEAKNAVVGTGSKVPHLSYVGDVEIGEGSNIGASTVVVNYDGVEKHRTTIGDHVRIGSDTMLVAPVSVGDGAYTAAGSVIVDDVPPGAMAVGRARQRNVEGWVARKRPGTASADAAARASAPNSPGPAPADPETAAPEETQQ